MGEEDRGGADGVTCSCATGEIENTAAMVQLLLLRFPQVNKEVGVVYPFTCDIVYLCVCTCSKLTFL